MESTVILVGDADMIQDNFTVQDNQTPFGNWRRQLNANLNFAQNAVEQLAGDNNLIAVRSRATLNRPFEVVRKKEAEASAKFRVSWMNYKRPPAASSASMNCRRRSPTRTSASSSRRSNRRRLRNWKRKASRRTKTPRREEGHGARSGFLKTSLTWWNIFAMPAVVTVSGILLAVYKRKLTAAK